MKLTENGLVWTVDQVVELVRGTVESTTEMLRKNLEEFPADDFQRGYLQAYENMDKQIKEWIAKSELAKTASVESKETKAT